MGLQKILYQPDIAVNGETSQCPGTEECQGCANCPEMSLFDVWSDDDLKWTGKRIEQECPPLLEPREPSDADNPPPSDRWTSPMKSPFGKTSQGLDEAFLFMGVHVRFNTCARRAEWTFVGDWPVGGNLRNTRCPWREWNDRAAAYFRNEVAQRFYVENRAGDAKPLAFGRDAWNDATAAILYENEVDPFIGWLETLPEWDGVPRVNSWLSRVFVVSPDSSQLAAWAGRCILLGSVWRAYQPGTKLDEMPVLLGKGGIGKSTALRLILPPELLGLFNDGLHLAADAKQRAEALQGRVIIEAAEMAGSTRADIASLKAFLSRTDDGAVRLAYRGDPELMLRRAVIVGAADRNDPLPNDPNLRRCVGGIA